MNDKTDRNDDERLYAQHAEQAPSAELDARIMAMARKRPPGHRTLRWRKWGSAVAGVGVVAIALGLLLQPDIEQQITRQEPQLFNMSPELENRRLDEIQLYSAPARSRPPGLAPSTSAPSTKASASSPEPAMKTTSTTVPLHLEATPAEGDAALDDRTADTIKAVQSSTPHEAAPSVPTRPNSSDVQASPPAMGEPLIRLEAASALTDARTLSRVRYAAEEQPAEANTCGEPQLPESAQLRSASTAKVSFSVGPDHYTWECRDDTWQPIEEAVESRPNG